MLALKKKREDEARAKADEGAAMAAATAGDEVSQTPGTTAPATKVSLLGIGGKKKKADGTGGATGQKKRSPGEIRIQKGEIIMRVIYTLTFICRAKRE
jgi:hypothetical protein